MCIRIQYFAHIITELRRLRLNKTSPAVIMCHPFYVNNWSGDWNSQIIVIKSGLIVVSKQLEDDSKKNVLHLTIVVES